MSRAAARRQLRGDGWRYGVLMLVPVLASSRLDEHPLADTLALLLFVAGLGLLFFNLPRFRHYKHALIATEQAFDSPAEPDAWARLRAVRLGALRVAALPAWLAAVGAPFGLEPVALVLFTGASLVLLQLYRVPRQLQ